MKYISGDFLSKLQCNLIGSFKLVEVTDRQKVSKLKNDYISKQSNDYCIYESDCEYSMQVFDTIKNPDYKVNDIILIRITKIKEQDSDDNWVDLEIPELIIDSFYELRKDNSFDYMMLDRLRTDCDYFLSYGGRNINSLWANNIEKQIFEMRRLWNSFLDDEKPEWLTLEKINEYEKDMLNNNKN